MAKSCLRIIITFLWLPEPDLILITSHYQIPQNLVKT